jgi:hypothetical protein
MGPGTKLDLQAFPEATRLPFSIIVRDVSALLGPQLVAYITGVIETRAIQQSGSTEDGRRILRSRSVSGSQRNSPS